MNLRGREEDEKIQKGKIEDVEGVNIGRESFLSLLLMVYIKV